MRKAPIVVGSTAVGLGLVLSFHTHQPTTSRLSLGSSPATTPTTGTPDTTTPGTTTPTTGTPTTSAPATTAPSTTRMVTGRDIRYRYGDIQLQVTENGSRITNLKVIRNGAADPRSAEINNQAVPLLQQQALQIQSANIDGVSGATFTSYAYAQSLQSALDQLKG
ncbi:MAG: FMN-binding protein [Acidimicrobiales bacterium]|nr:FMN-binding protein [Acidimicrobiales bacterium]